MTDLFEVMAEPHRPWLNPEALKNRFLQLSTHLHPDRTHGYASEEKAEAHRRFTELNTAYRCLQDPHQRLKHLLELETGTPPSPVNEIPASLLDAFAKIGALCRDSDAILARKSSTTSPLMRVGLFTEAQQSIGRLAEAQREIAARRDSLLRRLEALDARWIQNQHSRLSQPDDLLSELADVYRLLGYLQRWHGQLRERIVQLSL